MVRAAAHSVGSHLAHRHQLTEQVEADLQPRSDKPRDSEELHQPIREDAPLRLACKTHTVLAMYRSRTWYKKLEK